jgi:hypothetical protein
MWLNRQIHEQLRSDLHEALVGWRFLLTCSGLHRSSTSLLCRSTVLLSQAATAHPWCRRDSSQKRALKAGDGLHGHAKRVIAIEGPAIGDARQLIPARNQLSKLRRDSPVLTAYDIGYSEI